MYMPGQHILYTQLRVCGHFGSIATSAFTRSLAVRMPQPTLGRGIGFGMAWHAAQMPPASGSASRLPPGLWASKGHVDCLTLCQGFETKLYIIARNIVRSMSNFAKSKHLIPTRLPESPPTHRSACAAHTSRHVRMYHAHKAKMVKLTNTSGMTVRQRGRIKPRPRGTAAGAAPQACGSTGSAPCAARTGGTDCCARTARARPARAGQSRSST